MAYVQVPKDLTRVKTKVMFNLTQRQLVCFTLAAAAGIPFYLLTKNSMGSTLSACLMIVVIAYPFAIALGLFFVSTGRRSRGRESGSTGQGICTG